MRQLLPSPVLAERLVEVADDAELVDPCTGEELQLCFEFIWTWDKELNRSTSVSGL